MSQSVNEI